MLTGSVKGVVVDATMNEVTIQAENGAFLNFAAGNGESSLDTSGLKDGLLIGHGIEVSFDGKVKGSDTSGATVTSMKDAATACKDYDALTTAGAVLLAVKDKDLDTLIANCSFPLSIDDEEVADEAALRAKYTADTLFSDAVVQAMGSVNLMSAQETGVGLLVLSGKADKPNIIVSKTDEGWYVTGINR